MEKQMKKRKEEESPPSEVEKIANALIACLGEPEEELPVTTTKYAGRYVRFGLHFNDSWLKITQCNDEDSPIIYMEDEPPGFIGKDSRLRILSASSFWETLNRGKTTHVAVPDTLRELYLSQADLTTVHAKWIGKGLAKNPALTLLDLSSNPLTDYGVQYIGRGLKTNTNLRVLNLSNTQKERQTSTGFGFQTLFEENPTHLLKLDISRNNLGEQAVASLGAWLAKNPNLKDLDLDCCGTTSSANVFFEGLQKNTNIESLTCSSFTVPVTVFSSESLRSLKLGSVEDIGIVPYLPKLTSFSAHEGEFNNAAIYSALVKSTMLQSLCFTDHRNPSKFFNEMTLTSLSLINSLRKVGEMGALVAALKNNDTLRSLTISMCKASVFELFVDALSPGAFLANLTSITLFDNAIGDEGIRRIALWLRRHTNIAELNIGFCQFESEGARHVSEMLTENMSLKTLIMNRNDVGDEGASFLGQALSKNSTLASLNLSSAGISGVGAGHIATALRDNNKALTLLDIGNNPLAEGHEALLKMLQENTRLRYLCFDRGNSDELNSFLERNLNAVAATKDAVMCLLACRKFRREEFALGTLYMNTIMQIARYVWATRGDEEWVKAVIPRTKAWKKE